MSTLVEFLRARLDEDERGAQVKMVSRRMIMFRSESIVGHGHFPPDRVLAEVEAKRRIIDLHEYTHECPSSDSGHAVFWGEPDCPALRLLALPHADHPDYDEAWRP